MRLNERFGISNSVDDGRAWTAQRLAYQYQVHTNAGEEILAFHWHPERGSPDRAHLHISSGAGTLRPELQRAHVPTGPVSLEDFLAFLIRDFDVRERRHDWEEVLTSSS